MEVCEMFSSIQGEGVLIGQPTFFVRLAKCNLRCLFCDTKYSWSSGVQVTTKDVISAFKKSQMKTLTVTGGEPLLQDKEIVDLAKQLPNSIYIETNGTIMPSKELLSLDNVRFTVSPKLSNSGMKKLLNEEALKVLATKCTCFKFVVGTENDIDEALWLCDKISLDKTIPVVMQPLGQILNNKDKIQNLWKFMLCVKCIRDIRFILQQHVVVFGQKRGV